MSPRAKKIIRYLLLTLLALVVVAYFAADYALNQISRESLRKVAQRSRQHGIEITTPNFKSASVAGLRTARWHDLTAELQFPNSPNFDADRLFELQVKQLEAQLTGSGQVALVVDGLLIDSTRSTDLVNPPADEAVSGSHQRIKVDHLECQLDWQLFNPTTSIDENLPKIVELITAGSAQLPLTAAGTLEFVLKGNPTTLRLLAKETPTGNALALEPSDVDKLSAQFDEKLTAAEVELVAANPLRAPHLLRIKDDAESTARRANAKDSTVPEDAYRHILWSYLLTKKYGEQFAEKITDAHEEGDTGNTPAERNMDLNNNRLGRQYAKQKLRRDRLLAQLQKDPKVILNAEE